MATSGSATPAGLTPQWTPVEAVAKSDPLYPYTIGDNYIIVQWYNASISTIVPEFEYLFDPSTGINYPPAQWVWNDFKYDTQPTPFPTEEHKINSGAGAIPAGFKAVVIVSTADGVVVEGVTLNTDDSMSISATDSDRVNATLPAITPAGGSWAWVSLDSVEL